VFPAMAERSFVVVRSVGKVPAMASCANCGLKFFTPPPYASDVIGADEYLRRKFDRHRCQDEGDRGRAVADRRLREENCSPFTPWSR
jgi:hypothetical protein